MIHIEGIAILKRQVNTNVLVIEELKQQITSLLQQKEELVDLTRSIEESIKVLANDYIKHLPNENAPVIEKQLLESIPEVPDENK